jgi:hypothetical protein
MPDGDVTRKRLKCPACYAVGYADQITNYGGKDGKQPLCPDCGLELAELCARDHPCTCTHTVTIGNAYCQTCGEAVCPYCGSHDVVQISRVTGYMQDISGFNAGKRQEVKDRKRYNPVA